jgi:PAS domain S-box-containing protein
MKVNQFPYFFQLLQQLPDGIVACDSEGKLSYFNETLRQWHGIPEASIPSEEWASHYSLYHEDGKTLMAPEEIPLRRAFQGHEVKKSPMAIAIPGAELRYCEASGGPLLDDNGKKVGAFVVMHDVTNLVRSRDLLKQAIETSIAGFDIVSEEGKIIYANQAYLKMWGYASLDEILEASPVGHCADPETPIKIITALKQKGECTIEFKALRKDKSTFDVLMSARLDHDQLGREIYPSFSMDLTEIKKAIKSRDAFLSIASHELLTPLTSLKLQTQLLLRKLKDPSPELTHYLNDSLRFVGRLNRLVEDMLDISRITSGKFTIHRKPVDILEILKRKHQEFIVRYPKETIELLIEAVPGTLMFDSMRFEQVLDNLLSNAARYASGTLITLQLRAEGDNYLLSVIDKGPGIPLESQKLIFERFERLPGMEITGLGLGLNIVQEIVHLHEWEITLISAPGKGAEFRLTLPHA